MHQPVTAITGRRFGMGVLFRAADDPPRSNGVRGDHGGEQSSDQIGGVPTGASVFGCMTDEERSAYGCSL